ncbi:MAG: hypothetical protein HYX24_03375 [Candidatus Aenigmarchaeota archaeon]|nr:hypothetical protein [Candidatus Aenigmarchaeota archaeon]
MELQVLERKDDKLKIEIKEESHTFLNILREKCWQAGALQATYMLEHPYLTQPKIVVYGKNPKKILLEAAKKVAEEAEAFEKEFKREAKK